MTRRLHTTDLVCISGEELSDLGARKEGWLDDPNLLISLDTHSLALANRSLILIRNWRLSDDGIPVPETRRVVKIIPELSPFEGEYISAIEWLVFGDIRALIVGTSCGYLLIFSVEGSLVHRQFVNRAKILKLRVHGIEQDLMQGASCDGVCIVMPGAIARIEGSDLKILLHRRFQTTNSQFRDEEFGDGKYFENSHSLLPYHLWNINKYGFCVDAAITGVMPPPLMEIQSSNRYYCAVSIGDDAFVSAYRLSVDNSRPLVGAILSKFVPATFSKIASLSKLILRGEANNRRKPQATPDAAQASPITCLKDHPRKGEKLTLSPGGTLAAITDSLGRILLLDCKALAIVRLWKGYREASCLFVEMLAAREKSSAPLHECNKRDYSLCLAIHAPRKGIIEVWQMRTGPRLLTISCPKGTRFLQPTYRSSSPSETSSFYVPLQAFFLNGDSGELSVLHRSVH